MTKKLRRGYTTGTCAQAATKAAVTMLLGNVSVNQVTVSLPGKEVLTLKIAEAQKEFNKYNKSNPDIESVSCAVRKDSGDDPDITNGILVYSKVSRIKSGIVLDGGIGVGRVTKPGLDQPVGNAAINRVPRQMILREVEEACEMYGYDGGIKIEISIPQGVELAKKTFNPRLGIEGGISVLGTSGIVEPMSEKALIETMYVEIRAQKARGNKNLLVFFGNYGEDFTRDEMKLDLDGHVTCSNFVGELLDYAVYCGFETLLLIGHSGKLVKVAQGVMNTHSKYADCRTELFALEAMFHGASVEVGREIYGCLTTDEVTKVLKREQIFEPVMDKVTEKIDFYMQHRVHGKIKTAALMFSNVYGILGKTKYADELIQLHKQKGV